MRLIILCKSFKLNICVNKCKGLHDKLQLDIHVILRLQVYLITNVNIWTFHTFIYTYQIMSALRASEFKRSQRPAVVSLFDTHALESSDTGSKSGDATELDPSDNDSMRTSEEEFINDITEDDFLISPTDPVHVFERRLIRDTSSASPTESESDKMSDKKRRRREAKEAEATTRKIVRCRDGVSVIVTTLRHAYTRLSKMSDIKDESMHPDILECVKWASMIAEVGEGMIGLAESGTLKARRKLGSALSD